MSSEYESSGNVAGLRAINLVEIARRQASAAPATVDEAEGSSEDEDEEESSSWGADSSEEEDEEAPLEVDSDASQDSWNGVAVEIQDTQSLADVLAGVKQTSGNVKPPPSSASSKSGEKPDITITPASLHMEEEAPPCCNSATDSLTFSAVTGTAFSGQSDDKERPISFGKETDFALTEQSHVETAWPTSKATEHTTYPVGKQLEAVSEVTTFPNSKAQGTKGAEAAEVTSFPSIQASTPVPEFTAFPEVAPARRKPQGDHRPTLTTSSGSDSWGDAEAIVDTHDGFEGFGMANSKTLQSRHRKEIVPSEAEVPQAVGLHESSTSEEGSASEEEAEDESEEEEVEDDDHEIEEDVDGPDDGQSEEEEHIEEAILMDRPKGPAEDHTVSPFGTVQAYQTRSQPTFSVAPPLEDEDEETSNTNRMASSGAGKVTFSSWSLGGDGFRQRSISEDTDWHFRSSCTRTTFRSSPSEGRSTPDSTNGWVRRTTLAAMSGALKSRPNHLPLEFHALPREVKPRAKHVLASTAYPPALPADDDFQKTQQPLYSSDVNDSAVRFSFRQGGRRCVTLYSASNSDNSFAQPRSQSLGKAPRDSSALAGRPTELSTANRPKTTGTAGGSPKPVAGVSSAARNRGSSLQPAILRASASTKSTKSDGDALQHRRLQQGAAKASDQSSEYELRRPPSGRSQPKATGLGAAYLCDIWLSLKDLFSR